MRLAFEADRRVRRWWIRGLSCSTRLKRFLRYLDVLGRRQGAVDGPLVLAEPRMGDVLKMLGLSAASKRSWIGLLQEADACPFISVDRGAGKPNLYTIDWVAVSELTTIVFPPA